MKFIKLLRFDLVNALLKNRFLLLTATIFPLFFCVDAAIKSHFSEHKIAFADYFTYVFGGMKEYVPSPTQGFVFPAVWIILILSIAFSTLNYPLRDIQTFGQQLLIRTGGRTAWWLSKCAWNLICVLAYNAIAVAVIALFCAIARADFSMQINRDFLIAAFDFQPADEEKLIEGLLSLRFRDIILPAAIMVSLNLFQMALSLFIRPVFSFLATLIIIVSSCYFFSPMLIGNYAMTVRGDAIMSGGVNFNVGIIIALVVSVCSVIAGAIRFKYYDIINKE